ncbi:WD40 repeat domain-containing protein [Pseudonocardia phyllosphaerae]|uniref:WD40 repeat domain-containing protein n=1 Tax=Pseudonocardia phyllosphaerae TaxID=3390502 RepID=UPI003979ED4B
MPPVRSFWDAVEDRLARDGADARLVAGPGVGLPDGVTPGALARVLGLEAHHLRRADLAGRPGLLAQQVLTRANATGDEVLARAARAALDAGGHLALTARWRTRPPSPALLGTLDGHGSAPVVDLAFEPGGLLLAVDADGAALAWDPAEGFAVAPEPFAADAPVRRVAVSGDGGLLAVAGAAGVRVLTEHGREALALPGVGTGHLVAMQFLTTAAGSTRLVVATGADAGSNGTVTVHDVVGTGAPVPLPHPLPVVALGTAAGTVVTADLAGTLRVWDAASGTRRQIVGGSACGVAVAGRSVLVTTDDGSVLRYPVITGPCGDGLGTPETLTEDGSVPTAVAAAGGDALLVARAGSARVDVVGAATPGAARSLTGHRAPVRALATTPDGRLAATGDDRGRILLWDLTATGPEVPGPAAGTQGPRPGIDTAATGPVTALTVADDLVVAVTEGGERCAYDLATGEGRWTRDDELPAALWADPSGRALFAADGASVRVAHAGSGGTTGTTTAPGTVLGGCGALMVTCDGTAGTVAVADARSGRVFRSVALPGAAGVPERAAVTPGGTTVVLAAAAALTLWRPAEGRLVTAPLPAEVTALALDDEGQHLLTTDTAGDVRIWTLDASGPAPELPVVAAVDHPDALRRPRTLPIPAQGGQVREQPPAPAVGLPGHRAVTGGADGTVRVWDLAAAVPLARVPLDGPVTALAASADRVVAGDASGEVHVLDLVQGVPDIPAPRAGTGPADEPPAADAANSGGPGTEAGADEATRVRPSRLRRLFRRG